MEQKQKLSRSLGPWLLWGLGVGYVISGMYFGWNLGLPVGGTLGMAIATLLIIVMYVTFTLSYTELACAIPKAGGVFDYTQKAFGNRAGFLAGMVQMIEFVFAPPAIAAAIGAYFHIFIPAVPSWCIALIAYVVFTALNIYGVKAAALFGGVITLLAVIELLIFAGITLPHFKVHHLTHNAFPFGWAGVWAAIPFAIWFFLGIEGVANVAEETIHPQKNIVIGFGSALATLVMLAILVFLGSIGVAGWEAVVYADGSNIASDSPLPLALAKITNSQSWLYHLLVSIGLLGLVASFHGIILAGGRATFEMGRVGYFAKAMGKVHPTFKTPTNALITNMLIGIAALLSGKTADIIIMACFGAICLYIAGTLSLFRLRATAPQMLRPYKVPCYPWFPAIALLIAVVALIAMIYNYFAIFMAFAAVLLLGLVWYHFFARKQYAQNAEC